MSGYVSDLAPRASSRARNFGDLAAAWSDAVFRNVQRASSGYHEHGEARELGRWDARLRNDLFLAPRVRRVLPLPKPAGPQFSRTVLFGVPGHRELTAGEAPFVARRQTIRSFDYASESGVGFWPILAAIVSVVGTAYTAYTAKRDRDQAENQAADARRAQAEQIERDRKAAETARIALQAADASKSFSLPSWALPVAVGVGGIMLARSFASKRR